jgi:hypothetical protein
MLMDIVIALVIVVIAAALGLTVHPLLWFIVIVAVLWLFVRRGSWSRRSGAVTWRSISGPLAGATRIGMGCSIHRAPRPLLA